MRALGPAAGILAVMLAACGGPGVATRPEDLYTIPLHFPNGRQIRVEQLLDEESIRRGMMFREDLPENRGLLFCHGRPGFYRYWMYQVKIPLDIVWIGRGRRIVEVVENALPCPGPPEQCPSYGGNFEAEYVLELRAGTVRRNGLQPGVQLEF